MIKLITNKNLLDLASSFLNAPATLSNILAMWSFKDEKELPINMQLFHRDAEDYKFIKFFIFLSDVRKNDGEQVYLRGTNSDKNLPLELYKIQRYSDELVSKYISPENQKEILGKAGSSWAIDPYGIHRGTVPKFNHRLLLQLQFSYNPVPIFNYKPYRYSKWNQMSDLAKYSTRLYLRK